MHYSILYLWLYSGLIQVLTYDDIFLEMTQSAVDWDRALDDELHESYWERVVALKEMFPVSVRQKVHSTINWSTWITTNTVNFILIIIIIYSFILFLVFFHEICTVDWFNFRSHYDFASHYWKRTRRNGQISGLATTANAFGKCCQIIDSLFLNIVLFSCWCLKS